VQVFYPAGDAGRIKEVMFEIVTGKGKVKAKFF